MIILEQRIHEISFQNDEDTIFTINDAENADSFAFGVELNTDPDTQGQLVTGRYNISKDKAVIVGNGGNDTERKNIYELDWEGNADFSGKIKTKGEEVATLNDISSASFGSLRKLTEPIEIITNLGVEGGGFIQYAGESKTIGTTGILPTTRGGTGQKIDPSERNANQLMLGNFTTLSGTENTPENFTPDTIPAWNENGQLARVEINKTITIPNFATDPFTNKTGPITENGITKIGVVADFPKKVMVDLATDTSALDETNREITLGTTGSLPINKIAHNSNTGFSLLGSTNTSTTWYNESALKKQLNIPIIKTLTAQRCQDTDGSYYWKLDIPNNISLINSSQYSGFMLFSILHYGVYRTASIPFPLTYSDSYKNYGAMMFTGAANDSTDNYDDSLRCALIAYDTTTNPYHTLTLKFNFFYTNQSSAQTTSANPSSISVLLYCTPS